MSRICKITGKTPLSGNSRSHALNITKRRWNVNLQKAQIYIDGKPTTVYASTRAIKTLRRNNASK